MVVEEESDTKGLKLGLKLGAVYDYEIAVCWTDAG